jgi:hypothetical protein
MIFQFGNFTNPFTRLAPNSNLAAGTQGEGLFLLLNTLVKFTIVVAGLFTFWNLIMAGYMFMSAGGDSKAVGKAWEKIWMSVIGLLVVAGSFVLAGIFGYLIFNDVGALINLRIFAP